MLVRSLPVVAGLSLVLGCSRPTLPSVQAKTELKNKDGQVVGSATFREAAGGVIVKVEVHGLSAGLHAVCVHAVGKCDGPAFTSAAGHFKLVSMFLSCLNVVPGARALPVALGPEVLT